MNLLMACQFAHRCSLKIYTFLKFRIVLAFTFIPMKNLNYKNIYLLHDLVVYDLKMH